MAQLSEETMSKHLTADVEHLEARKYRITISSHSPSTWKFMLNRGAKLEDGRIKEDVLNILVVAPGATRKMEISRNEGRNAFGTFRSDVVTGFFKLYKSFGCDKKDSHLPLPAPMVNQAVQQD